MGGGLAPAGGAQPIFLGTGRSARFFFCSIIYNSERDTPRRGRGGARGAARGGRVRTPHPAPHMCVVATHDERCGERRR